MYIDVYFSSDCLELPSLSPPPSYRRARELSESDEAFFPSATGMIDIDIDIDETEKKA